MAEELTAKFIRERHRFENDDIDVIIGEAWVIGADQPEFFDDRETITVKGPAIVDELRSGQEYVFYGKWTSYTNKRTRNTEKQFAFTSFIKQAPVTRDAVISYIAQHGEGIGIGKARATALWEAFGQEAVEIARTAPDRVIAALRKFKFAISHDQSIELANKLTEDAAIEKAKMNLTSLLEGRGFPRNISTSCLQEWGNRAPQVIRRDPYRLMRFKNCGFKRCDAMYLDLKLPPGKLKRQAYCSWHSVARSTDGSTWFSKAFPDAYLKGNISGTDLRIEEALQLAVLGRILAEIRTDSKGAIDPNGTNRWFAEYKNAQHERQIAQSIVYSQDEENLWPDVNQIADVTDHQKAELGEALKSLIGILGGSPGTGKTFTVASLVALLGSIYGFNNIAIGTPTGKAAVRVTENLSMRGIPIRAMTWHSLLIQLETKGLEHFPFKFLIGDESSMNDTDLMARILRARSVGTHILFVGDINQLPPVGHGAPIRDLIAAGVSYGELREIKRNSGGIVEACAAIRDGKDWKPGDNLVLDTQSKPEEQIKALIEWLDEARKEGVDPVWDCQPVVAVNERSELSRKDLNKILQQHLNQQPGVEGIPFRLKDKLVNTENGYHVLISTNAPEETVLNDKNEVYIANGELAKVIDIQEKEIFVELQSPHRIVSFTVGRQKKKQETEEEETELGTGCSFELGYALSVHKSQGSDWPWVLPMLDTYAGASRVCDRAWLYTAISRAKHKCILIGKKSTADQMCRHLAISKRKTFLREEILRLNSIEQLAGV